jgi:hypothetical protein
LLSQSHNRFAHVGRFLVETDRLIAFEGPNLAAEMLVRRLGEAGNEYADTAAGNRMIEARFRCECGMNRIVGRSDWHNRNI